MKFVVIGTTEFDIECSKAIMDNQGRVSAMISMPEHARPNNSADIAGFANTRGVPYHEIEDMNSPEGLALLKSYSHDYLLVSWPQILTAELLEIPRYFCIGTHPTDLPFNRGRHPLHWIIALGIKKSKVSFFRMEQGVDTGNILIQVTFEIGPDDYIEDVVFKMNKAAYGGTKTLYKILLADPLCIGSKQNHISANYWRKRTPHDVTIDLRMSSSIITRTVRSFSRPYPCANLIFENHVIKIVRASPVPTEMTGEQIQRIEPGKIILIAGNTIRVKVDDGIIDLECRDKIPDDLIKTKYIHPPSKYLAKWSVELSTKLLLQ